MRVSKWLLWAVSAVAIVVCLWQLEAERSGISEKQIDTDAGPVSMFLDPEGSAGPLVVVTHGFAGSRQMMQYIARDLARAGFTVASFDFYGHGRSRETLSPDVTRIEGTTRQLVAQTRAVTRAVQAQTGQTGPMALLGHSMATDIIIRAAQELPDVAGIVAISMYSDAVTARFPQRLLVLSGEWEGRLREVGLRVLRQVEAEGEEGQTVQEGAVVRRAVSVPRTEHVAVLFSSVTMAETRAWLQAALNLQSDTHPQPRGLQILVLLGSLVVLVWPVSRLLPETRRSVASVPLGWFLLAICLPVVPAAGAAVFAAGGVFGFAAFGSLAMFFGLWGITALAVLRRAGVRPQRPDPVGGVFLLIWALGGFALALDRYGAAFLPVGPRWEVMWVIALGTLPFAVSDRMLVAGASLWRRGIARIVPVVALGSVMALSPQSMGLSFTVLPVLVLFYGVYGTMARAVAQRTGPEGAGIALGIVLAWAIAASTPLFAVPVS